MGRLMGMKPEELLDLSGMVAIVTGAGDGIGAGCAEILAAAGAKVVVSNRTLAKAENIVASIKATGGEAIACTCNVLVDAHWCAFKAEFTCIFAFFLPNL